VVFLVFELDGGRFALSASQVVEVVPFVHVRPIPQAPLGVAGICEFRGAPVPVVDMSLIVLGRPAPRHLSTRIVIARSFDHSGNTRFLALIAEKATATIRRDPAEFVDSGITNDRASYLGPVASDERGMIQWIDATQLLPAQVREVLSIPSADRP
jgi:chemotaxis-related protein WspB